MKPQQANHNHRNHRRQQQQQLGSLAALCTIAWLSAELLVPSEAVLVQPFNYMLDDSGLVQQHDSSGSLSPFHNDQQGGGEQSADRDIVGIIGDSLARLRYARMLEAGNQEAAQAQAQVEQEQAAGGQLSAEMAELVQKEQQEAGAQAERSLGSSVAGMLMEVAQAAASSAALADQQQQQQQQQSANESPMSSRGSILELDTSAPSNSGSAAHSGAGSSKSDLKQPVQWYNPKETIPVLKISSMATPSKYKKVYFRSEKKLVDGAFHSPSGPSNGHGSEQAEKKSLVKPFNSAAGVQRRSSRGSASSAPQSLLQDGVIDFLKKFRDVYVQTRPLGQSASPGQGFAGMMAAASPLASIMAPISGGARPSFAGALSAASQMVNGAAMLSQAASQASPTVVSAPSAAGASSGASVATTPNKSSSGALTPQSYVSFWSKTFPTWVRKMLKQMRRRSLYNSSKRHQQQQHAAAVGQKVASGAVTSALEASSNQSAGSGGSSSLSSSSSSGAR